MRDQAAINAKISAKLKGKPSSSKGVSHTEESKQKMRDAWVFRPRTRVLKTDAEKRAANKANVYAYRARKYGAVLPSSDLKLITKIYEACPDGYHVDHIVSLATGGPHHQDNLQYLPISENCRKGKNNAYDESLVIRWQSILQMPG